MNERCPKCGEYLNMKIKYSFGEPIIEWTCPVCGYSLSDGNITVDDKTKFYKYNISSSIDFKTRGEYN